MLPLSDEDKEWMSGAPVGRELIWCVEVIFIWFP
jgi:hypothetical protein